MLQETWVQSLDWADPLKEAWQPTPVFLPGEFQGQRSLVGYSPWGHKKLDRTEQITLSLHERYTMCKNNHERKTFPNTGSVRDNIGISPMFWNWSALHFPKGHQNGDKVGKCKKMSGPIKLGTFFFYYALISMKAAFKNKNQGKSSSHLKWCLRYQVPVCFWFPVVWMIARTAFQTAAHLSLQPLNAILPHLQPTNQFMY